MRYFQKAFMAFAIAGLLTVISQFTYVLPSSATPLTFTVTNVLNTGVGSFRQAVLDANANPGHDTIAFNIPGIGPHNIPTVPTYSITDPVTIDGLSQPGSQCGGELPIVFDFTGTWNQTIYLYPDAQGSIIQGTTVIKRSSNGGYIVGAENTIVRCNYFELTYDGQALISDPGSSSGLSPQTDNIMIGGPNVSDTNYFGRTLYIHIADDVTVQNNAFGYSSDLTTFLGPTGIANSYQSSPPTNRLKVINNILQSISIGASEDLLVQGNKIGVNPDVTATTEMGLVSIRDIEGLTFGGPNIEDRNYIGSSNHYLGTIDMGHAYTVSDALIENNYFGVRADGTGTLDGIGPESNSSLSINVHTNAIVRNNVLNAIILGYNGATIGSDVTVENNKIGVLPDGVTPMVNRHGQPVKVHGITDNVVIHSNIIKTSSIGVNVFGYNDSRHIEITNNNIEGSTHSGILIDEFNGAVVDGTDVKIDSNTITTETGVGINNEAANAEISNNSLIDSPSTVDTYGLMTVNARIHHNNISRFANGIWVTSASQSGTIAYNTLDDIASRGIRIPDGTSVHHNTLNNIGLVAMDVYNPTAWWEETTFSAPVIREVVENSTETAVEFEVHTRNAGDYEYVLCYSPESLTLPSAYWTRGGLCEQILGSTVRTALDAETDYTFTITVNHTGLDTQRLSMFALEIDNSQDDGYGSTSPIARPHFRAANLSINIQANESRLAPGELPDNELNSIRVQVCNSGDKAVTSFELTKTFEYISGLTLVLNTEISSATNVGTYNSTTDIWNGTIVNGDCIFFDVDGTVADLDGVESTFQTNIVSATTDSGNDLAEEEYGNSERSETFTIAHTPDMTVSSRLLTTGPITPGSNVTYDMELTNLGQGAYRDGYFYLYLVLPEGTSYTGLTDPDTHDNLDIADSNDEEIGVQSCQLVAEDISAMGPPFEERHNPLVMCMLLSQEPFMPGDAHNIHLTITTSDAYTSGTTSFIGFLMNNEPDQQAFFEAMEQGDDPFLMTGNNNLFWWTYDTSALTVTTNLCEGQPNPTIINDACFTIIFNKPIHAPSFTPDDITIAGGGTIYSFIQDSPTQWTIRLSGLTFGQESTLGITYQTIQDLSAVLNTQVLGIQTIRYGQLTSTTASPDMGNIAQLTTRAGGELAATGTNTQLTIYAFVLILTGLALQKSRWKSFHSKTNHQIT